MLTFNPARANLTLSLPHEVIGIGVPKPQRRKPLLCGFFTRKISVHHYVGLSETVERLASSLGWYANLAQLDTIIGVMWSGLKTFPTEAIMPKNHAQKTTQQNTLNNSVSLIPLFSLQNRNKNLITSSLIFQQVKPLDVKVMVDWFAMKKEAQK